MRYPVVIHKDPIRAYNVSVPDLPERVLLLLARYASEHDETRSGLIVEAATEYIARRQGEGEESQ